MKKLAILGFGTVGSGVAEVLGRNGAAMEQSLGERLETGRILVRTRKDGPYSHLMTTEIEEILDDPEITVLVETIGGCGAAYAYTRRALLAGKHVVTANKELVAEHGCELLRLAAENGVRYLFEASVGGGIPILHPLTQCMSANRIEEVTGILNGTTNYILSRMACVPFAEALREAQEKGYAEADPTADVAGIDACRKICILSNLAFGKQTRPAEVETEGIERLALADVQIARAHGYRVKLLGRALRLKDGGRSAYVAPHLVAEANPLSVVEDVFNGIMVRGNATGELLFYGRGAGAMPTASAVLADVMSILRGASQPFWSEDSSGFERAQTLPMRFYYRACCTVEQAEAAFGAVEVWQQESELVFLTAAMTGVQAAEREKAISPLARLRVLG